MCSQVFHIHCVVAYVVGVSGCIRAYQGVQSDQSYSACFSQNPIFPLGRLSICCTANRVPPSRPTECHPLGPQSATTFIACFLSCSDLVGGFGVVVGWGAGVGFVRLVVSVGGLLSSCFRPCVVSAVFGGRLVCVFLSCRGFLFGVCAIRFLYILYFCRIGRIVNKVLSRSQCLSRGRAVVCLSCTAQRRSRKQVHV